MAQALVICLVVVAAFGLTRGVYLFVRDAGIEQLEDW